MTEPTKGPWRWERASDYVGGADVLGAPGYVDAGWPPRGNVVLYPTYEDSAIEWHNDADARLIEKAPDMLEVLRRGPVWSDAEWVTKADALVAYILGEPTREEEEASTDGPHLSDR